MLYCELFGGLCRWVNMSMLIRFKVLMCISINLMWLRKKNIKEKIMSFIQHFILDCNPLSILLVDLWCWNLYQWVRAHSYCWAGLSPPVSSLWGWCSSNTFSWLPQVTQVLESYFTNICLMYRLIHKVNMYVMAFPCMHVIITHHTGVRQ